MMELFWTTLANGLVALLSAVVGAACAIWFQAKRERIRRLEDEKLYVEYGAIKEDGEGYYIPGHGRIAGGWGHVQVAAQDEKDHVATKNQLPRLDDLAIVKKYKTRVAFICVERSPGSSLEPYYIIDSIVPL